MLCIYCILKYGSFFVGEFIYLLDGFVQMLSTFEMPMTYSSEKV